MPKKVYTAHAMNGKKAAISTHKTYTNLGAAKHDARQMAKLIPNGKGLVVAHGGKIRKNNEAAGIAISDAREAVAYVLGGLRDDMKEVREAWEEKDWRWLKSQGLSTGEAVKDWLQTMRARISEKQEELNEIDMAWRNHDFQTLKRMGILQDRHLKANPSLRDYFTAGKKAVMGAAEQAAAEAQEAAKRARIAAAEAEKQRSIDSPEKALKVLAAQQGYDLVRKNPGSWKKEISAWGKLPFLRFVEAYSDELGDHAVFEVIKGFVFQATETLSGPKREWTATRVLVSKSIDPFTKRIRFYVDLQGHSPTDILDVIDEDFNAPTLDDAKSKLRSLLSRVKLAPRKNPRDNRPGTQLVFGHEVHKIKGGYRIVPYHLDLPTLSAVKTYLRAHVAQEKRK